MSVRGRGLGLSVPPSGPIAHDIGKRPSRFAPKQEELTKGDHHQWCIRMWRRMDRHMTGYITAEDLDCDEFRSVLKSVLTPTIGFMGGASYMRAQMNMDQAMRFLMRKADQNLDMVLSFQEFQAFMWALRQEHLSSTTADLIFALFDLNSDGRIDESEFRELHRFYLGRNPTEQEHIEEWAKLDVDVERSVTKMQYAHWLETSAPALFRAHGTAGLRAPGDANDDGSPRSADVVSFSSGGDLRKDHLRVWRPWHSYGHLCWAQVKGPSATAPAALGHTTSSTTPAAQRIARDQDFSDPLDRMLALKERSRGSAVPADRSKERGSVGSATASGSSPRPKWNRRLATANPNWISPTDGMPKRCKGQRGFFSKPQSLPELRRHFERYPHLQDNLRRLDEVPRDPPRKHSVLSTECLNIAPDELMPGRSRRGPHMIDGKTRERSQWDEHFQIKRKGKDLYQPGTVGFRCPGPPPPHLYEDVYETRRG